MGSRGLTFRYQPILPEFVLVAIDYTLGTPERPSRDRVMQDIGAAVAWARALPGVDPDRTVLLGGSAGGHLALLYAYQHPGEIALVVSVAGCGDLAPVTPELTSCLLGHGCPGLTDYNPVAYVTPDAPPTILIHGRADRVVPMDSNAEMIARLDACGVPCELHSVSGGHVAALQWEFEGAAVRAALAR